MLLGFAVLLGENFSLFLRQAWTDRATRKAQKAQKTPTTARQPDRQTQASCVPSHLTLYDTNQAITCLTTLFIILNERTIVGNEQFKMKAQSLRDASSTLSVETVPIRLHGIKYYKYVCISFLYVIYLFHNDTIFNERSDKNVVHITATQDILPSYFQVREFFVSMLSPLYTQNMEARPPPLSKLILLWDKGNKPSPKLIIYIYNSNAFSSPSVFLQCPINPQQYSWWICSIASKDVRTLQTGLIRTYIRRRTFGGNKWLLTISNTGWVILFNEILSIYICPIEGLDWLTKPFD